MNNTLTLWNGLVYATGGTLVPKKSFWYLINFKWVQNKWQYTTTKQTPVMLQVQNKQGQAMILPRLEPSEAQRTLQVWLAPDRNNQVEYQHLVEVALD